MACSLSCDDEHVSVRELEEELGVEAFRERRAVVASRHFRFEHGVVLGERVPALDFQKRLPAARERVEKPRFIDHAGEGMPFRAEQAVVGPEVKSVLAGLFEFGAVVLHLVIQERHHCAWVRISGDPVGNSRIGTIDALPDLLHRDHGVGGRVRAVFLQPERREEDLEGVVRIEGEGDVVDDAEIAIDEFREADVVIDRTPAAAGPHVEGAFREAEVLLEVDAEDVNPRLFHGRDGVSSAPALGLFEDFLGRGVVSPILGILRLEEWWDGECGIGRCLHRGRPFVF